MPEQRSAAQLVPAPTPAETLLQVHPGRIATSKDGTSLITLVGSGAVVCVWDPFNGIGGMSHFLLPEAGNAPAVTRFGDVALKVLLAELASIGANGGRLRARVYGGSTPPIVDGVDHLGVRNVAQALSFLSSRSVPVLEQDVGGSAARRIVFRPARGTAYVSRIGPAT